MSRPTNEFRALKLLYDQGANVSHKYIQRELNLSVASYNRLRTSLVSQGYAKDAGSGARGLGLTRNGRKEFEANYRGEGRVSSERELYDPLCSLLQSSYSEEGDEILNVGALKRRGAWQNPDVLRVTVRPSVLGKGAVIRLVSYEVKRWDSAWWLSNVFETAAHAGFCHESYLVLEWATGVTFSHDYLDAYGLHLLEACRRFGVGIFVMQPHGENEWRLERALLASDARPSDISVNEYLGYVLGRKRYAAEAKRLRDRAQQLEQEDELEDEDEDEDESED
ncbi:MAG TPA: hypothetical protein VK539_26950 [Myxococcaceae bacterium]|nr:hypothetical protein [Myxococcaceae bacterium]